MRVEGLSHNLFSVLLIPGVPISVIGLIGLPWAIRGAAIRPVVIVAFATFLVTSLVFPVATTWGTFLHAAGPAQVLLVVSALLALDAVDRLGRPAAGLDAAGRLARRPPRRVRLAALHGGRPADVRRRLAGDRRPLRGARRRAWPRPATRSMRRPARSSRTSRSGWPRRCGSRPWHSPTSRRATSSTSPTTRASTAKLVVLLDADSTALAGRPRRRRRRRVVLPRARPGRRRDPAGRRPARRRPRVRDRLPMNDGPYTQRPMEPARAETDSRDTRFDDVQTRIGDAQEAERSRLAQEIHDGPAQALSNAIFQVEYIERVIESDPLLARTELRYLRELLRRELGDVRAFISQLRPPLLDQYGLDGALMDTIDRTRTLSGLIITSDLAAPAGLLSDREQTVVLRVTQEALQNVRKHAAAAHVVVSTQLDGAWVLEVRDDGRGFHPDSMAARGGRNFGLQFMRERAELIGARIRRTIAAGGRYRRPSGDPDRTGRRRRGEHMTATDYSGPERRRGGPDRRALDDITKILVVDDHALFRMGIANILGHEPDFAIVAEADDSRSRHRPRHGDLARHHPDGPLAAGARAASRRPSGSSASCRPAGSSSSPRPRTRTRCSTRSRPARPPSSSRTSARTTSSRSSAGSSPASTSSTTRSSPSRPSPRASSRSSASWRSTARTPPRSSRRSPRARSRSSTTSPRA